MDKLNVYQKNYQLPEFTRNFMDFFCEYYNEDIWDCGIFIF